MLASAVASASASDLVKVFVEGPVHPFPLFLAHRDEVWRSLYYTPGVGVGSGVDLLMDLKELDAESGP